MKKILGISALILFELSSLEAITLEQWRARIWNINPMLDPIRGSVLLDTSNNFIYNLRFFGISKSGRLKKNDAKISENQKFTQPIASLKDSSENPISDLVVQLWPSASIGFNYQGAGSFDQYFSKINDNKTKEWMRLLVVGMLRFAKDIKDQGINIILSEQKQYEYIEKYFPFISVILGSEKGLETPQNLDLAGNIKGKIRQVIKDIYQSVKCELGEGPYRYPSNTTIDVINAYAWQVILGDEEVDAYKRELEKHFRQDASVPGVNHKFSSYFARIFREKASGLNYTPWGYIVPDNGRAEYQKHGFADCVETAIREFFCWLFYNSEDNQEKQDARRIMLEQLDDINAEFKKIFITNNSNISAFAEATDFNLRTKWVNALYENITNVNGIDFCKKEDVPYELDSNWRSILRIICRKLKGYKPVEKMAELESAKNPTAMERMIRAKQCIDAINKETEEGITTDNTYSLREVENNPKKIASILEAISGIRPDCVVKVNPIEKEALEMHFDISGLNKATEIRPMIFEAHPNHCYILPPAVDSKLPATYSDASSLSEFIYTKDYTSLLGLYGFIKLEALWSPINILRYKIVFPEGLVNLALSGKNINDTTMSILLQGKGENFEIFKKIYLLIKKYTKLSEIYKPFRFLKKMHNNNKEELSEALKKSHEELEIPLSELLLDVIEFDDIEAFQELIEKGADIDSFEGYTIFHTVARYNSKKIYEFLIKSNKKEKIKDVDQYGQTPLLVAADNGSYEICKLLLEHGATDVINQANEDGSTPLLVAAGKGSCNICKLLLDYGATDVINQANEDGNTPLFMAAYSKSYETCKLLLDYGATDVINQANKDGSTPLLMAADNGSYEICELLLKHGADINQPNKDKQTPLLVAAENENYEICELLLEHDADINQPDKGGQTPLLVAARNLDYKIYKLLLEHGADINQLDPSLYMKDEYDEVEDYFD